MKSKLLSILLISICSCTPLNEKPISKFIALEDIFSFEECYLIYFYSDHCGHCLHIKDDVDQFSHKSSVPFYYLNVDENELTYMPNKENLIGANMIEEFFIVGTPSLIEFINKTVTNYYLGEAEILEYITGAK